uniref:Dopamine receptor D2a n=1 Tax=Nothobranchius pienaari TaxID=704102 RepID=A0A1A8LFW7_9TELE
MRGEPTPEWDSGNVTVWEQHFDVALVVANCLVLLITSVVGIAANIFVILAVCHQKSLQTSVNALVVNLAAADFLRCVLDCPILLDIITTVHQKGHMDILVCDTQMASFNFSSCVQLLTLACISAERYQAIANPFQASQRKRRIMVLLPLTWTLAFLVAVFCQMFLKDSPVYAQCKGQKRGTSPSGLFVLLLLWAACFGVITGFYARIFALIRSHNRKIFDKGVFVPKKGSTEDKPRRTETADVEDGHSKSEPEQILSISTAQTQAAPNQFKKKSSLTSGEAPQFESISSEKTTELKIIAAVVSHLEMNQPHPLAGHVVEKSLKTASCSPLSIKMETKPSSQDAAANIQGSNGAMQKASSNFNADNQSRESLKPAANDPSLHVLLSAQRDNPESASFLMTDLKQEQRSNTGEKQAALVSDQTASTPPDPNTEAKTQNIELEGAVCIMPSKVNRERARKNKESRMAKRAGFIILTFLLFWLPLITSILVNVFTHKNKNPQVMSEFKSLTHPLVNTNRKSVIIVNVYLFVLRSRSFKTWRSCRCLLPASHH